MQAGNFTGTGRIAHTMHSIAWCTVVEKRRIRTSRIGIRTDWTIRLDMPVRIRVTRYALHSRNNDLVTGTDFPDTFVLEGSNDGSTWSSLDSRTDQAGSISEPYTRKEYSVSTSSYYSKIRLWVTSVGPNGTGRENAIGGHAGDRKYVVLTQFELYGTMEEEDRTTLYWIVGGGVVGFLFLLAIVLLL